MLGGMLFALPTVDPFLVGGALPAGVCAEPVPCAAGCCCAGAPPPTLPAA